MSKASDKDKKTPKKPSDITTMAVNILVSERIESYCKSHGMLKKDFIPRAVEFIENFNVDLTAETLYLEDKQAEKEAKEAEKADIQALPTIRKGFEIINAKFESIMQLQHNNGTLTERAENLKKDKEKLHDDIAELKEEIALLRETANHRAVKLERAKNELKRLKKGLFNKPDEDVLKELGIE